MGMNFLDLAELFPLAPHFHTLLPIAAPNPERYGLSYKIEVMLHNPTNSLLGSFGDLKPVEEFYRSMSFIAGFAVEINETNLFDDIILPFPTYLERFDFLSGTNYIRMETISDRGQLYRLEFMPVKGGNL